MDDLQLHLALSNHDLGENRNLSTKKKKKRTFHESFSDEMSRRGSAKRTLPLLNWGDNRDPGTETEDEIRTRESAVASRGADVDGDVVVGWPPVNSSMRKMAEQHRRESTAANYVTVEINGGGGGGGGSDSMYVKVEMEGIGIARKIDLSVHRSYETLTSTLIAMFGKRRENVRMYKLTYQDKEGDWLLAGDVPWRRFVGSVRRLKLLREGQNNLVPDFFF